MTDIKIRSERNTSLFKYIILIFLNSFASEYNYLLISCTTFTTIYKESHSIID